MGLYWESDDSVFNMLSRFVIAFLPRGKCLNFMAVVTICSDFGAQEKEVCDRFHFPQSVCHEVMGLVVHHYNSVYRS